MIAAPILYGSFEATTPAVATATCGVFASGSAGVTSWAVVGAAGTNVAVCNTSFVQAGISFVAEDGSNWLDLTRLSSNNDTEGVRETLPRSSDIRRLCLSGLEMWIARRLVSA